MSVTQASLLGDTFGSNASGTIPIGGIIMWTGISAFPGPVPVPTGWQLCDNTLITSGPLAGQLTPDLRSKFIVGAGNGYAVGDTGGQSTVTLSTGQVPYHRHFLASSTGWQGNEGGKAELNQAPMQRISAYGFGGSGNTQEARDYVLERSVNECDVGASGPPINDSGIQSYGQAHENRPPYYALAFIMRVS